MSHAGPSSGREAVNWDDQVVPALRRRLEYESAYISDRMSTASFPSVNGFETADPTTLKREHSARARTKSSHAHALGPVSETRPPTVQQAPHSAPRPSRIPMRPRSKSNLGARVDQPTPPIEDVPELPPGLKRGESGESRYRGDSPEMMTMANSMSNDDLKNELPPFRLRKGEAMRIAEKGHDLRNTEEIPDTEYDYGRGEDSLDGSKRKRRQSMRTVSKNPIKMDEVPPIPVSASGLPRSATGNVGLGLPSTRSKAQQFNQAPRSSSSRQALNNLSSSTTTPRSPSMNMLAHSNSRLGIAAHLVPPESKYTPPKGQAWDEVVLPTVAKKLGLGESPSQQGWVEEDGDLAVEWDKSGTPIKWIKKETVSRLGGPGEASKAMKDRALPGDDYITRQSTPSHLHPLNSSTKSAFSPTFEPSPDNPLYPRHLQPRTSHSSSNPTPSPTPHRQISKEHLQPHPIRASSGKWTSMRHSPPSSPAPFSQMQPVGSSPRHMNSFDNSNSPSRRQGSHRSENTNTSRPTDMYSSSRRPTQSNNGAIYDGQGRMGTNAQSQYTSPQSDGRQMDQSAWSPASIEPRRGKKDKDSHGKGCGCTIM